MLLLALRIELDAIFRLRITPPVYIYWPERPGQPERKSGYAILIWRPSRQRGPGPQRMGSPASEAHRGRGINWEDV